MNKEVNFEIAKLLQEKGFEQEERPSYLLVPFQECTSIDVFGHEVDNLGYGDMIGYYLPNKTVNAPKIAEVVMWLYEKHRVWISVDVAINGKFIHIIKKYNSNDRAWELRKSFTISEYCNSPIEAYEAYETAIKYALENLI